MTLTTLKNYKSYFSISSEIISLDEVDIYMISPGIIVTEYKMEFVMDIQFAEKLHDIIGTICKGKSYPHLVIACPGMTATKEVREWGATEFATQHTTVTGVVCNSLAHRIMGNFIIKVQRPPKPLKMFTQTEDALSWLKQNLQ